MGNIYLKSCYFKVLVMNYFTSFKRIQSLSLLLLPLMVAHPTTFASYPTKAITQFCNRNPGANPRGVSTLASNSATVEGYVIKVQLRYNQRTREKWVRACVPVNTTLYLEDEDGNTYGAYQAQVNGWNFADKVTLDGRLKACISHPSDSRVLCTRFN
jgi:hypothetical protein